MHQHRNIFLLTEQTRHRKKLGITAVTLAFGFLWQLSKCKACSLPAQNLIRILQRRIQALRAHFYHVAKSHISLNSSTLPSTGEEEAFETIRTLAGRGVPLSSLLKAWQVAKKANLVHDQSTTGEFAHCFLTPLTAEDGLSYVEYDSKETASSTKPPAPAEHHVVHSWGLCFRDVLLALASYANEGSPLSPTPEQLLHLKWHKTHRPENLSMTFFFCPFSVNQHTVKKVRLGDPRCEIDKFYQVSAEIYRRFRNPMLIVLDPSLHTLGRSCCLEEIYAALTENIPIRYIGHGGLNAEVRVDARSARAWDAGVQRSIYCKIRRMGVEHFNHTVNFHLQQEVIVNMARVKDLHSLASKCSWNAPLPAKSTKRFLVVGQCGDGKSTLVNSFRNPLETNPPRMGRDPRGVTKEILEYPCKTIAGDEVTLIDTPGVGDHNITPMELVAMLEQYLEWSPCHDSQQVNADQGVHGVIVTNKVTDNRLTIGASIVQTFIEKGMIHGSNPEEQWANVILVGTKRDLATEQEIKAFSQETEDVQEYGGEPIRHKIPSLASVFFENAPLRRGLAVTVSHADYSELERAIPHMPSMRIDYRAPEAQEMAKALAHKFGIDVKTFEDELKIARTNLFDQVVSKAKSMKRSHRRILQDLLLELRADEAIGSEKIGKAKSHAVSLDNEPWISDVVVQVTLSQALADLNTGNSPVGLSASGRQDTSGSSPPASGVQGWSASTASTRHDTLTAAVRCLDPSPTSTRHDTANSPADNLTELTGIDDRARRFSSDDSACSLSCEKLDLCGLNDACCPASRMPPSA